MLAGSRWRVVLGFGAVALLAVLAGCSYSAYSLHVSVDTVESTDDGVDLDYTVWRPDEGDFTFHEVSVHGYGPNGTVLCKSDVGTVGPNWTHRGRLSCSGFPQLIVLDAAESNADTDNPSGVRIPIYRYAGYNETDGHEWTYLQRREMIERDEELRKKPLPPDETLFERVKCEQRVADENVSALGATPWINADVGKPDRTRRYRLLLTNASSEEVRNGTVRLADPPAIVGTLVRQFQRRNESGSWVRDDVNRPEWFEVLRALGDGSVSNATDFPAEDRGRYRSDTRGERCWNGGGEFGGALTAEAEYVVTVDGRSYYLLVEYTEEWN
jgi:hypothetical protein